MMRWYEAALKRFTVPIRRACIDTASGETHVLSAGSASNPPVVLVHGINVNAIGWRRQFERLAPFAHVIAPDVIGFSGRSAAVRHAYSSGGYTRWMLDVLNAFGLERPLLVGSSGGGWYSLKLAAAHPDRVGGLVLINPCGLTRFPFPFDLFRNPTICALVGAFGRRFMASPSGACRLVQMSTSPDTPLDPDTVAMSHLLVKYFKRLPPPGPLPMRELARITAPVLLLMGEREPYFNVQGVIARARKTLANVRAEIVPRAGHDLHHDQADVVAQYILNFMQR